MPDQEITGTVNPAQVPAAAPMPELSVDPQSAESTVSGPDGRSSEGDAGGIDPALLDGAVRVPFAVWGHPLADAEAQALAAALAAVLEKYMPSMGGEYGPEIGLIVTVGVLVGPRFATGAKTERDSAGGGPEGLRKNHAGETSSGVGAPTAGDNLRSYG